jgi:hypothetical protein
VARYFRKTEIFLTFKANQFLMSHLGSFQESAMSDQSSELVEISKLNGDFKRNYGKLLGAMLYLRSISAARGRSWFWAGLLSILCSTLLAWLTKHGPAWLQF